LPAPLREANAAHCPPQPSGQPMTRYPPEADAARIVKDLKRLLKVSAPD
jgi:hypothetical protein